MKYGMKKCVGLSFQIKRPYLVNEPTPKPAGKKFISRISLA